MGRLDWFQNTRLIYWSTMLAGDYSLTMPFFDLHVNTLDFIKYKTKEYYGYDGVAFPKTITLFGCYSNTNYGAQRENRHKIYIQNRYIRYLFSSGLEIACMMLKYFELTKNKDFLKNKAIPFIIEILKFYKNRFDIIDGKMLINPTMSLETWQECADDTPTIARLNAIANCALSLNLKNEEFNSICSIIQNTAPDIPYEQKMERR